MTILFWCLTFIATLSPTLTLLALWQTKEWRYDRLREYIRDEGIIKLWGTTRLILFVVWIASLSISFGTIGSFIIITILALLSAAQILLQKQRKPVWTAKAKLTLGICLAINLFIVALGYAMDSFIVGPVIAMAQPLIIALAWIVLMPIDFMLKQRIFKQARLLRSKHPDLIVIGITGSVGKTTTKELLAHTLSPLGAKATPAHVNTEMGVSEWLIKTLSQKEVPPILIIEMGAYRKGEIALMCSIAQTTMGILTYIGTQHIGLFGSQKNLQDAKSEIIKELPEDGHAFLNGDNELIREVVSKTSATIHIVATGGSADLEAFEIEEQSNGVTFVANGQQYLVPIAGTHNVTNILLCIAAAKQLGMSEETIAKQLQTFTPPNQTFFVKQCNGVTILNDTHNASQASFKAAITWAKSQPNDTKVLLTDGLIELGTQEDSVHTSLGSLSSDVFDRVIFLGKKRQKSFAKGYKNTVEQLTTSTDPVKQDTLLVCLGRMPHSTIEKLLP